MPSPVPALALSDIDRQQVQQWVSAFGTPQQVVLRCRIVLGAAAGQSENSLAQQLGPIAIPCGSGAPALLSKGPRASGRLPLVEDANPPMARRKSKPSSTRPCNPSPKAEASGAAARWPSARESASRR